ncbi:MAG: pyridoxamine 5'-phosphate oxidase family protein [Gammaproteobacteria bacterium]
MQDSLIRKTSAWSATVIEQFLLDTVIPIRLACLGRSGAPLICSVWFIYDEGFLWCATQHAARLSTLLGNDPRCAFEIAGDDAPYRGVRGQGNARLSRAEGPVVLQRLVDRYLQSRDTPFARWLVSRQDDEVAIRIQPDWLTSWDFSTRMTR